MENKRRTGRTTRIADRAVQDLLTDGKVTVKDHSGHKSGNVHLMYIIINRLSREHNIKSDKLDVRLFNDGMQIKFREYHFYKQN